MITINHGFSAMVCGRVLLPILGRQQTVSRKALLWAFLLGGLAPDGDIRSKLGGRAVYFSDAWYAHREASHSVLGALALGLVVAGLVLLFSRRDFSRADADLRARAMVWLTAAGWAGGLIHIVGDLFTPGMTMPVFWPLPVYFGGLRHIGWFSPYLLWLFVAALTLAWAVDALGRVRREWGVWCTWGAWGVNLVAAWRWLGFMVVSRYESSVQWVEYHRELLPDAMIDPLQEGVRRAWYWLTG